MTATTPTQRREAQRAQTRSAILSATESLLIEHGVEAFSIRKLVAECGYSAPTIYQHFGDKDGLLDALVDESFERLTLVLRRLPKSDDPVELLRSRARAYIRFSLRHSEHVRLLSTLRAHQHAPPRSTEETRALLEKPWLELWEAGRLRAGDWKSAAQALGAVCHGIVMGRIEAPDHDWSKTLAEDAIDALLRGLVIDGNEGSSRE
jgi:AcrR family transcriptional regulator